MKPMPPFDFTFPSSRLKKTMKAKIDDRRMNEIDATDRTLTKFLRKVIVVFGPRGAGPAWDPCWRPEGPPLHVYSGPLIPPSLRTRQK